MEYIYIIQLREFVETRKPIYKIGRTVSNRRFYNYPKNSILHFQMACVNNVQIENKLKEQFDIKYKHKPEYGREYYEGNVINMIKDTVDLIISFTNQDKIEKPQINALDVLFQ